MRNILKLWIMTAFTVGFMVLQASVYAQESTTVGPLKDSSIWSGENGSDTDPELSNGAGPRLIVGINGNILQTGRQLMRSPVTFDLSGVPNGATITSATVELEVSSIAYSGNANTTLVTPIDVSLHRLTSDWGEGTSDLTSGGFNGGAAGGTATTGDATWTANFFGGDNASSWTNPGGDFVAQASATTAISSAGGVTWSSTDITTDVQNWVNGTNDNYGWMIVADETYNPDSFTNPCCIAVQFDSREASTAADRPALMIEYTLPVDDEDPVAVCDDVTVKLNLNNDDFTLTGELLDGGSTDNVGIASLTPSLMTVGAGELGTTEIVTLTVADPSGNTATCQSSVFVTSVADVNADGNITPSDAVYVVNRIGTADADADVNGVNDVTVEDVQAVIDLLGPVGGGS